MKQLLFVCVFSIGCGTGPTSPTPVEKKVVEAVTEVAPPAVEEPIPVPPLPAPLPAPTRKLYSAATESAHWYQELVPNRFEVELFDTEVQFGSLRLTITTQERDSILCVERNHITLSLERESGDRWRWTVNALEGQGTGEMELKQLDKGVGSQ